MGSGCPGVFTGGGGMKLLTPEDMEAIEMRWSLYRLDAPVYTARDLQRAYATIKALAERLARVERCKREHSGHKRGLPLAMVAGKLTNCPDCDGTDNAHKDWRGALRALGEE